jgi:hypothetical protein
MKIRNCFVSNSSSSSFVLLTTEENHKKILEQFTMEEQEVINSYMSLRNIGTIKLMIFQQLSVQGWEKPEIYDRDIFSRYKDALKESTIFCSQWVSDEE